VDINIARIVKGPGGVPHIALRFGAVALALGLVALAAGQAVGPILSGSTSGEIGATVSQAITVDTENLSNFSDRVTVMGANDWVSTTDDEGTHFTVAFEANVGDTVTVHLFLLNRSDKDASAKLVLDLPAGVDVSVDNASGGLAPNFAEAQLSRTTWLLTVDEDAAGNSTLVNGTANKLSITIETKDDFKPGFYQVSGRIVQIEG